MGLQKISVNIKKERRKDNDSTEFLKTVKACHPFGCSVNRL